MEQMSFEEPKKEKEVLIADWAAQLRSELKPKLLVLGDIAQKIKIEETKQYVSLKAGSNLIASFRPMKSGLQLEFKTKYDEMFPNAQIKHKNEKTSSIMLKGFEWVLQITDVFYEMAVKELSGAGFGCCSRYEECSDARKCTQPMKLLSLACQYRKNLEQGRIFYGKNRNIPE